VIAAPASRSGAEIAVDRPARRHRALRHLLVMPTAAWTLVFFVAPLALITVFSFASENLVTFSINFGWTAANYGAFGSSLYLGTLLRSVALSAGTTAGCALLGFPLAYFITRQPAKVQRILLAGVIVPFWTSFLVRTYSLVNLLQNGGPVDNLAHGLTGHHLEVLYTPKSIAVGIVYSYLPLMVLPIYVALERVNPELYDAAADLGARPWRQFRRVVFPLARPGLIAGIIIVGVPAMGEYVIPEILGGGKTLMIGNIIVNEYLDVGNYPFGSALAVSLMAVLMVVLFALRRVQPALEAR
jgi:spermidine/putrescine transport system permease protein